MNEQFGYIYVIEAGPYFKIGKSVNPHIRVKSITDSIQKHDPKLPLLPVRLVGICACPMRKMSAMEKTLHRRFDHLRAGGEWFLLGMEDLEWIFTQNELPLWEERVLWEFAQHFNMPVCVPNPS